MSKKIFNEKSLDIAVDEEINLPKMKKVIMLNDNYTDILFVIKVLGLFFGKSYQESKMIAETIHNEGQALVATLPESVAVQKVEKVVQLARKNNFPLEVKIEE